MRHPTRKYLIQLLCGTVLFAGGFFVGIVADGSGSLLGGTDPESQLRAGAVSGAIAIEGQNLPAADAVRDFEPGRPFPKGRARDWILTLTPSLGGDRRGNAIALMQQMPAFLTMDKDSVREVADALQELIAEADARNPKRRRNPNGDGVLDTLLEFALIRMARTEPDEALELLKQNFDLNDGSTRVMVIGTLAASDPQRAEQMALSLDKGQQREALESVLYALMNTDPSAAMALAARHQDVINVNKRREEILEGWLRRDPRAAMNAAVQAMAASGNSELVRSTIEEWTKSDPAAAAQWAAAHEGPGSIVARAMVLEKQAREDPQGTLDDFATLQRAGANPADLAHLTSALADALARKNVVEARTWAENLPAGELQDRALHQVAEEWVRRDAPAASEWIETLPPGKLRDGAAQNLVSAISKRDPAGAFAWARSISSESVRQSALQNALQNWHEQDPDAAKAALESLPAEQRPSQ